MKLERWRQIDEVFQAALERTPDERTAFIGLACGGDDSLRQEVEALLASDGEAGSLIEAPAYAMAAPLLVGGDGQALLGKSIGHYRVIALLGKGGMGEVYRAEDTHLHREVAIKVLPNDFAKHGDRLRRFEQEAWAASALNHPNIITIHEIGEAAGARYIVTEYVAGETLRQLLTRLPEQKMEPKEAVETALQIATALTAAHEAGIIHRDIKPENVMVRPDGLVKVLDFGLVKLTETKLPTVDLQASNVAKLSTDAGVVMGTVSYMSPEQTRGLKVDHRTDIFSLGVMLYEMVAGRRPFEGETTSDVIAAILQNDPPPVSQPGQSSLPEIEQVISRMIEKNRETRYQSVSELRAELRRLLRKLEADETTGSQVALGGLDVNQSLVEAEREGAAVAQEKAAPMIGKTAMTTGAVKHRARWFPLAVVALLTLSASVFWFVKLRGDTNGTHADERPVIIKTTQLTSWKGLDFYPTLARDGNTIAFSSDRSGSFEIYLKQLIAGAREVQITADGGQNYQPAFSPDGSLIAYHSKKRGGIWVVPVSGGAAKQLTELGSHPAWSPDGSLIAFQSDQLKDIGVGVINALPPSTLWIIPSRGGEPRQLTQSGAPPGGHGKPSWSKGGKRIVFDAGDLADLVVWSVSVQGDDLKKISGRIKDATDAIYAPDGNSIFVVADTGWSLYKISLSEAGDPLGEPVRVFSGSGPRIRHFSIAADGKNIAYSALSTTSNIWATPLGPNPNEANRKPVQYTQNANTRAVCPAFSPNGKTIAYHTFAAGVTYQIWTMDADGKNQTQITTGSGMFPWWFPDGSHIAFESRRETKVGFWSINIENGREKKLFDFDGDASMSRLSPDGKRVAFNSKRSGTLNLWLAPIEGGHFKQLTFDKELMGFPAWSPDGKWIAFQMKRGVDTHVGIIPSDGGEPVQLTSEHGQSFLYDWSPDGMRLLFAGQRDGVWNVQWVSRLTKQQKQLTSYTKLNTYVRWPAWSPLGDKVVYEYAETTGNIWLMELK